MPTINPGTGALDSVPANNMASPLQMTFRNATLAEVDGDFNNVFTGEQGQRTMGPPKTVPTAAGMKHKRTPSLDEHQGRVEDHVHC
jgi:hypothetical protein